MLLRRHAQHLWPPGWHISGKPYILLTQSQTLEFSLWCKPLMKNEALVEALRERALLSFQRSRIFCLDLAVLGIPDEGSHLFRILNTGRRFDAAAYIHPIRPDPIDRFGHVIGRQTAGQNDRFA
jgi:hypothetical protein